MTIEANEMGIPQDAMKRLAEMRPGQPGALFTSDLSVNEFLLVREAGFRPLGLEHLPRWAAGRPLEPEHGARHAFPSHVPRP